MSLPVPSLRPARPLSAVPFGAAALALAVETTTHLVDFGVFDLRIGVLDSAGEWSYSHVLATIAFAIGATAGAAGALRDRRRLAWWGVFGGFALLLADNVTRAHEHIGVAAAGDAILLVILAVSLVALAARTGAAPVVYAGLGLLLLSLTIHVLGPHVVRALGWSADGWAYQVKVALKEGTELAGWTLVTPAVVGLARHARPTR